MLLAVANCMSDKSTKSASESNKKCDYSERFRSFRGKTGIKQSELAALLDSHPNYISQIERGEKVPGKRLLKEFIVLEDSPAYNAGRSSSASPVPPHLLPPERGPNTSAVDPTLTHQDFTACVSWLSNLFDRHPVAFRMVMGMIKGVHDQENKK